METATYETTTEMKEVYLQLIQDKSSEDLIATYLDRNGYTKQFVEMLIEELRNRGIPVEKLTPKEASQQFLIKEKTAEEFQEIDTTIERFGVPGKHIFAGYLFSVMGGLIGVIIACDYYFSTAFNNGERYVYKYDKTTRNDGKNMLIIIAIVWALVILSNIL